MIKDVIRYQPPDQWGVLCIDVWDHNGSNNEFYYRAVENLAKFNITCVVNCTTDIKIDYSDPSIYNTFKYYQWNPKIQSAEVNQKVMLRLMQSSGQYESSSIIKTQVFGDHTVHLSSTDTFIQHVNHFYPDVKDWIVLGNTWHICLHYGPLGFDKLLNIPTTKFNIFPSWSVQKLNGLYPTLDDIADDGFVWANIPNNGFRLITKVDDKKWKKSQIN